MNYPLKSSSKSRNKNRRLKAVVAILLFAVLFFVFRTAPFKSFVNKIALPFWKIDNYATGKFSDFFSILVSKKSLILDNKKLEEELSKANVELSLQKIIEKENNDLKTLLGRGDEKRKVVLGIVLEKSGVTPFDVIIIDIGKVQAVQKGDKVLYDNAIEIGQIEEVFEHSSKVKLYSSPGQKFTVLIGSKSIQAEAEGIGGGNFTAKLPRDIEINKGDAAVVPTVSSSVFGFVEEIEVSPTDSFQKILFKIPLNLAELRRVQVEIKP